ncbi:uncharacterized protein LOC122034780 [Zingiber officinale]|uniref:Uncharacterized protein n=1 Tax=Zingiber officinale TaxID=94328 RepID=A0A8J5EM00_ZINOF|nr:uncharacterized protein LOC122034780 [Zingiber officinale]KAG6468178.1 hypothetical protein ZIOFF_072749 [Zingiber officinale]
MVVGFRRSISLPGLSASASRRRDARHTRSASFPCHSHPALSLLHEEILSLRTSAGLGCYSSFSAASDLERIDRLLAALDGLLRLPQTQDPLRRCAALTDRLLDGFLRLADAQSSFRSAVLALAQHGADASAATRRRDPAWLASAARSHRREEKEIAGLALAIKDLTRCAPTGPDQWADADIAAAVAEALAVTATRMAAVFLRVAGAAATAAASIAKNSRRGIWVLMKKRATPEEAARAKVEEIAAEGTEEGSNRVHRSLVNIRVSLLNIITPSL